MKKSISEILGKRKAEIESWTGRTQTVFGVPQLSMLPMVYEVAERTIFSFSLLTQVLPGHKILFMSHKHCAIWRKIACRHVKRSR